jgi:hypothetical protein
VNYGYEAVARVTGRAPPLKVTHKFRQKLLYDRCIIAARKYSAKGKRKHWHLSDVRELGVAVLNEKLVFFQLSARPPENFLGNKTVWLLHLQHCAEIAHCI